MTLALRKGRQAPQQKLLVTLGLFGAALFYGDGVITPAISVLSAVEGWKSSRRPSSLTSCHHTGHSGRALCLQRGTASVGPVRPDHGPLVCGAGIPRRTGHRRESRVCWPPSIRQHAFGFLLGNALLGFFALGAVVLCITGQKRSMRTWGTSAPGRFNMLGWATSCRPWSSTISDKARCCWRPQCGR